MAKGKVKTIDPVADGVFMNETYSTTATLTNKRTLVLDEILPLPAGRVRVTIEALPEAAIAAPFLTKLRAIHKALADSGYQPRSKEAVDAQIRVERASWE